VSTHSVRILQLVKVNMTG